MTADVSCLGSLRTKQKIKANIISAKTGLVLLCKKEAEYVLQNKPRINRQNSSVYQRISLGM